MLSGRLDLLPRTVEIISLVMLLGVSLRGNCGVDFVTGWLVSLALARGGWVLTNWSPVWCSLWVVVSLQVASVVPEVEQVVTLVAGRLVMIVSRPMMNGEPLVLCEVIRRGSVVRSR